VKNNLFYDAICEKPESVVWIDAVAEKVSQAKSRGINNIYQAVISKTDGEQVVFNISNNIASSSILPLGTHLNEHPHIHYTEKRVLETITVDSFMEKHSLDPSDYEIWNLDLQGAELLALMGAEKSLKYVKCLYLEVNERHLYVGCPLLDELDNYLKERGFTRVFTIMTPHHWGDAVYLRDSN
jgi:FkbM family methyltransferase